jgi:hypothetical protein
MKLANLRAVERVWRSLAASLAPSSCLSEPCGLAFYAFLETCSSTEHNEKGGSP